VSARQRRPARQQQRQPKRPRTARRSRARRIGVRAAVVVAASLVAAVVALLAWAVLPGPGSGAPKTFRVAEGAGSHALAQQLASAGLVRRPWWMAAYLALLRPAVKLEPGEHLLNDGLSPRKLVQRLARLPGRATVRAVLPEGWNHVQIGERLEKLEVTTAEAFREAVAVERAEGFLFPATYELNVDTEPHQLIALFERETKKRLERLSRQHPGALERLQRERGWGERELITLASIVEKEAATAEERPMIASVFYNRLSDPAFAPRQMLQSDPTAAYGCLVAPERAPSCTRFDGRVTPEMLRDGANAYNTYRRPGLPPGPISNPGESAIAAVLSPASTPYLFFVARGGGRHAFSRTLDEHNAAIERTRE